VTVRDVDNIAECYSLGCRVCQACIDTDDAHADTDECDGGIPLRLTPTAEAACRTAGHDVRPVAQTERG
jgi:hypothetical protein